MIPITHPFRKVREKDGAPGNSIVMMLMGAAIGVVGTVVTEWLKRVLSK